MRNGQIVGNRWRADSAAILLFLVAHFWRVLDFPHVPGGVSRKYPPQAATAVCGVARWLRHLWAAWPITCRAARLRHGGFFAGRHCCDCHVRSWQSLSASFLIDWPEPFGLSMIEAMACGTPVLALRRGSAEEVVDEGVTGYVVDSVEEAIVALPRIMVLNRCAVRRRFEERFTSGRTAKDYLRVYKSLYARPKLQRRSSRASLENPVIEPNG